MNVYCIGHLSSACEFVVLASSNNIVSKTNSKSTTVTSVTSTITQRQTRLSSNCTRGLEIGEFTQAIIEDYDKLVTGNDYCRFTNYKTFFRIPDRPQKEETGGKKSFKRDRASTVGEDCDMCAPVIIRQFFLLIRINIYYIYSLVLSILGRD
jgi:hypothetical protein